MCCLVSESNLWFLFKLLDQVIMDWMGSQVSGVVRGLLGPEVSQDPQGLDRKVTDPAMELFVLCKFNLSLTKTTKS